MPVAPIADVESRKEATWSRALAATFPAVLLACVLLLPFAGKAFTIDDTVFMRQAEHVLVDPLHPSALTMVWSEVPRPMRLSQLMPTGPVMAWLLAPAAAAGGSEVVAHLVQLALLCLAIVETGMLALRLGYDDQVARLASMLLASTPAVLGMAGSVMPDVAAMMLAVAGIERLCAWRDGAGTGAGTLAALALALAPLARTHAVLVLGLSFLLLAPPWKPGAWKKWLPVAAAPLVMMALLALTRDPQGGSADLARAAGTFSSLGNVRSNVVAFGVHWVLVLPLGLAWAIARGRRFWATPLPWIAVAAAMVMIALAGDAKWLWIAPVAGLGVAVVADVVADCVRSGRRDRIALGLWLLVAVPIVVYLHFPSKYLLASAPAAAILAAAALLELAPRSAQAAGGGLVAAGALLGSLIVSADATFAGLGRRAVAELIAPRTAAGETVWFNANWGFQWYAERAGARILTTTPPKPKAGDLVVSARETIHAIPIQSFRNRELVATVTDASPGGRIISSQLGAGFYSNGWGYLPWAWGSTEVDRFELWRLR